MGRIRSTLGSAPAPGVGVFHEQTLPHLLCYALPSAGRPEPLGRSPRPGRPCPVSAPGDPVGTPTLGSGQQNQRLKSPRRPPPAAWSPRLAWPVLRLCGAAVAPHCPARVAPSHSPAGSEVTHLGPATYLPSGTWAAICEEGHGFLSGGPSRALPASGAGARATTYPFGSGRRCWPG